MEAQGNNLNSFRESVKAAVPRSAPWAEIPQLPIVSVEHPCLITSLDKAVASLGGESKMQKLVEEGDTYPEAQLYLHPEDRMIKPISSFNVKSNNIVVKITVPKRTGMKRRRGAQGPFYEPIETADAQSNLLSNPKDSHILLRSMRDDPERYSIEAMGNVSQTHRFRRLPDFSWSTSNSPFMKEIRENLLPFEYPKLKEFSLDLSKGPQPIIDLIPPPRLTSNTLPFNYVYHQNPAVKQVVRSDGLPSIINSQAAQRNRIPMLSHSGTAVPTSAPSDVIPESDLDPQVRALISVTRELFKDRPVWSRRALQNSIPGNIWSPVGPNAAKYTWQYVGYIFSSGPWRDTLVRLGYDPRTDPEARWYQSLTFQLDVSRDVKVRSAKNLGNQSHIFDGERVALNGKLWQMCDITDPFLRTLLGRNSLRNTCHTQIDGWYTNGLWAKIRTVMKHKIYALLEGGEHISDWEFKRLDRLAPDVVTEKTKSRAIFPKRSADKRLKKIATDLRVMVTRDWARDTAQEDVADGNRKANEKRRREFQDEDSEGEEEAEEKQADIEALLDPRLKSDGGELEEVAREINMHAFEDVGDEFEDEDAEEEIPSSEEDEESDDSYLSNR